MVAIQDAEQQQAAATSTDDWESMTKEEQTRFAAAKFDEGKSNYIKMDFPNAADCLALSLEVNTSIYGPKALELYEPLYFYAKTLLEIARCEEPVVANAITGLEEASMDDETSKDDEADEKKEKNGKIDDEALTEEQQEEVAEKVIEALEENAERIEHHEPLPTEEEEAAEEKTGEDAETATEAPEEEKGDNQDNAEEAEKKADESAAEEPTEESQGEEDIDDIPNIQLAYESIETARIIAEEGAKSASSDENAQRMWKERICDALIVLADICIVDDEYARAIDELKTLLEKQADIMPKFDRRVAEAYFQMGRAYTQWNKFSEAADVYAKSLECINAVKKDIAEKAAETTDEEEKKKLNDEVDTLEKLIVDIEAWVKDSVDSAKMVVESKEKNEEESKEANAPLESQMGDAEGKDISSLVRKRKVDAEETKENVAVNGQEADEGTAAKKAKVDGDITADNDPATTEA